MKKDKIRDMFKECKTLGMSHIIIAEDLEVGEEYVVYTKIVDQTIATLMESESQTVLAVYNIKKDMETQLNKNKNWSV